MKKSYYVYSFIFILLLLFISSCKTSQPVEEEEKPRKLDVSDKVVSIGQDTEKDVSVEEDVVKALKAARRKGMSQQEIERLMNKELPKKGTGPSEPFYEYFLKKNKATGELNHVTITFDSASIEEVVPVFSQLLGFNFYLDPKVKGVVTMSIDSKLAQKDLWNIFEQILCFTGSYCSLKNELVRIVPFDQMAKESDIFSHPHAANVTVALFRLKSVVAKNMIDQLKPFITDGAVLIEVESQNAVMVVESPANIEKIRHIVRLLDTANKVAWPKAVIRCDSIPASKIVDELAVILPVLGFPVTAIQTPTSQTQTQGQTQTQSQTKENPGTINMQGVDRMQLIVASAATWEALNEVKSWVKVLDRSDVGEQNKVFIYNIKNTQADQIIQALSVIFNIQGATLSVKDQDISSAYGSSDSSSSGSSSDSNQAGTLPSGFIATTAYDVSQIGSGSSTSSSSSSSSSGSTIGGSSSDISSSSISNSTGANNQNVDKYPVSVFDVPTKVFADAVNERLIIRTTPRVYAMMKALLNRLDTVPSQVLLKVTIADIQLTASTDLGLEIEQILKASGASYTYGTNYGIANTVAGLDKTDPVGFQYIMDDPNHVQGFLRALAQDGKITVLATPEVLVQSHTQALVSVGDSIPMLSSSSANTSSGKGGDDKDINVTNNYEYKDTGIILKITPHITKGGLVSADIDQLVSTVSQTTTASANTSGLTPTIRQRRVVTSLSMPDGGTIVIGGLIENTKSDTLSTVPFLGNIPILDRLLGNTTISNQRSELLLTLSAKIVTKTSSLQQMVERYKNAVELIINGNEESNIDNNIILQPNSKNKIIFN